MEQILNNIIPNTVNNNCRFFKTGKFNCKKFVNTCKTMNRRKIIRLETIKQNHDSIIEDAKNNLCELVNQEVHELDALAKMIFIPEIVSEHGNDFTGEEEDDLEKLTKTVTIVDCLEDIESEQDEFFAS